MIQSSNPKPISPSDDDFQMVDMSLFFSPMPVSGVTSAATTAAATAATLSESMDLITPQRFNKRCRD